MTPDRSVLIVGNFLSAAGNTRAVCEDLADRLAGNGWQVTRTSGHPGRLRRLLDMVGTAWRRRHHYEVAQIDVFSGPAFLWAEAVCLTLRLLRKPFILTLHGGGLPEFAARWPGRVRRVLRPAQVVTVPSRYLLEQMQPYRDDLLLLPNPLAVRQYPFRRRDHPAPRLVWLRAFHAVYNPTLAVRALAALSPDFPQAHLTMIGPRKDETYEETLQMAEALGVRDRLETPGSIPKEDVPRWLSGGDIFINTTNADNTPVSVIEALACGLGVVTTNVGGIPYLVRHEQEALLVPPDDLDALVAAIRRLLADPTLAGRLSQAGRALVEPFDWDVILPQWEKLLGDAARGRQP